MCGQQGGATARALLNAGAGVGVGTLYRRYPSRDALLEALTLRSFQLLVALAEEAEVREGDALARLDWRHGSFVRIRADHEGCAKGSPAPTLTIDPLRRSRGERRAEADNCAGPRGMGGRVQLERRRR